MKIKKKYSSISKMVEGIESKDAPKDVNYSYFNTTTYFSWFFMKRFHY